MYLVTGAATPLGGIGTSASVVELLRGNREPVRAMVRREDALAHRLRELGAGVVVGSVQSGRHR